MSVPDIENDQLVSNAIQVLLSEKRTSLAMMRTGIAIIALPLAITSALIATSSLYEIDRVSHMLASVMIVNALLLVLGVTMVASAYHNIAKYARLLHQLKKDHPSMSRYLD